MHTTNSCHPHSPGQGFTPHLHSVAKALRSKWAGAALAHPSTMPTVHRRQEAEALRKEQHVGWGCRRVGGWAQQLRVPSRNKTGRKQETSCCLFSGLHFKSWESPVFIKRKGKKPPLFTPSGIRAKRLKWANFKFSHMPPQGLKFRKQIWRLTNLFLTSWFSPI